MGLPVTSILWTYEPLLSSVTWTLLHAVPIQIPGLPYQAHFSVEEAQAQLLPAFAGDHSVAGKVSAGWSHAAQLSPPGPYHFCLRSAFPWGDCGPGL